jgi:hypothetical protein
LKKLISAMQKETRCTTTEVHKLLTHVKPELRYPLLRLILANAAWFGHDIDIVTEKIDNEIRELWVRWPANIFEDLPAPAALGLCRRLMAIHPNGQFLSITRDTFRNSNDRYFEENKAIFTKAALESYGDIEIMQTFLESQASGDPSQESAWLA